MVEGEYSIILIHITLVFASHAHSQPIVALHVLILPGNGKLQVLLHWNVFAVLNNSSLLLLVVTILPFMYPILFFRGRAVPTFRKDVVLLEGPETNEVPRQRRRYNLHNLRHIIQGVYNMCMDSFINLF